MKEIIQKLLELGWKPDPCITSDDYDYYLWRKFEISKTNELENYTDYKPKQDEKIFLVYEIYPNRLVAMWYLWRENDDPIDTIWETDDYGTVIDLALEDRLFTYPQQD